MRKAVCIISGGMDSSTCAHIAKLEGFEVIALHFSYGQRTEKRELLAFRDICKDLNVVTKYELDLSFFKEIGCSALTDHSINVPITGITNEVPITYVPFRNGIFLSIAGAIAEKHEAESIYIGVVEEDSSGYPDCRKGFIDSISNSINLGTKGGFKFKIRTPLINMKKEEIVKKATEIGVNLEHTWSCYKEEEEACGVCDSCRLRLKGFELSRMVDKIRYKTAYNI